MLENDCQNTTNKKKDKKSLMQSMNWGISHTGYM